MIAIYYTVGLMLAASAKDIGATRISTATIVAGLVATASSCQVVSFATKHSVLSM